MDHHGGRAGLEALAGRLYACERGRLLTIARQNSDRPEDAEEALQEAFCLFLAKFDPRRFREPRCWLSRVSARPWFHAGGAA